MVTQHETNIGTIVTCLLVRIAQVKLKVSYLSWCFISYVIPVKQKNRFDAVLTDDIGYCAL